MKNGNVASINAYILPFALIFLIPSSSSYYYNFYCCYCISIERLLKLSWKCKHCCCFCCWSSLNFPKTIVVISKSNNNSNDAFLFYLQNYFLPFLSPTLGKWLQTTSFVKSILIKKTFITFFQRLFVAIIRAVIACDVAVNVKTMLLLLLLLLHFFLLLFLLLLSLQLSFCAQYTMLKIGNIAWTADVVIQTTASNKKERDRRMKLALAINFQLFTCWEWTRRLYFCKHACIHQSTEIYTLNI